MRSNCSWARTVFVSLHVHMLVLAVSTKMKKTSEVGGKGKGVCQMFMTIRSCRIQMQRLRLLYVVAALVLM